MPSVSKKQHKFMAAVAKNPAFAKKVGVPRSVGEEFLTADKGKKFGKGGEMKESKMMVKKEVEFMKKKGAPKAMMKHEMGEMKAMKKGGSACAPKKMAAGGMTTGKVKKIADTEVKAHEKRMHGKKMAGGGLAAGHKSADGIATKGKTKARQITMKGGGYC